MRARWLVRGLLMMTALLIVVAGCYSQTSPPPSQTPPPTTEPAPPTEAEMNAAVESARKLGTPTDKPVVRTPTGLQYIDVKEGAGEAAKVGDTVAVHYTGWLTNGQKFDSSRDRNQTFPVEIGVTLVIQGWTEGLQGMKRGGIRKLIIPPDLGYGSRGSGPIPPNSILIFEVEYVGKQ